jgi:hypothetical protein
VRAATHAGGAAVLVVGDAEHLVRLRVEADLVLLGVRDRVAEPGVRRRGDDVDAVEVVVVRQPRTRMKPSRTASSFFSGPSFTMPLSGR